TDVWRVVLAPGHRVEHPGELLPVIPGNARVPAPALTRVDGWLTHSARINGGVPPVLGNRFIDTPAPAASNTLSGTAAQRFAKQLPKLGSGIVAHVVLLLVRPRHRARLRMGREH